MNCCMCGRTIVLENNLSSPNVCNACLTTLVPSLAYLESLDQPAAIVARDHTILFSNSHLRKLIEFAHDDAGIRIGEALDCQYAEEHEPCGETEFCFQCELRRFVALARITGERIGEIPMSFRQKSGKNQTLRFSTEKAGDAVLLMISSPH